MKLIDKERTRMKPQFVAYFYETVGRCQDALHYLEMALKNNKAQFGENNLYALPLLQAVARVNRRLGNFQEAMDIYECVLQAQVDILGMNHSEIAYTKEQMELCRREFDEAQCPPIDYYDRP